MNYFRRKRKEKGISSSDMANMLGIDYKKYVSIDRGDLKMPSRLIDKFNEIINKGKNELKLETLNNEQKVNKWFEEISKSNGEKLKEKMNEFNILTYKELAELIGCKPCTISGYITKGREASYNFKNRLYLFFNDELNVQEKKEKKQIVKRKSNKLEKDLQDFYNQFNFEDFLLANNLTYTQFADMYNIPRSTFFYYIKHKNKPSKSTVARIKQAVEDYKNENKTVISLTPVHNETSIENIIKVQLFDKYIERQKSLDEQLEELNKQIDLLNEEIDKTIAKKQIYDEIINDIQEGDF